MIHGILNLEKPSAITSARAVAQVKRLLPRGTKIGHAGTLDPFATGVLLLLIGRATKLCESLMNQPKRYEAVIKLGAITATDDSDSAEVCCPSQRINSPPVECHLIDIILSKFVGQVQQIPPIFSALKVGGKRAYQLSRNGKPPSLSPRSVTIYSIERMKYDWPLLKLRVDCGRGTYIRALARDIGAELGVGGYLTELCRTRVGPFSVESALALDHIPVADLFDRIIPIEQVKALLETQPADVVMLPDP